MSAQNQRIYHRIQVAARDLRKVADQRVLEATGLTTAQVALLAAVKEYGPCRQQVIASALGYNESAVTAMVRRLESSGHLRRQQDAYDGRARVVTLTDAGARALSKAVPAFAIVNAHIDAALDEAEIERLAHLLDRVRETIALDHDDGPD